MKPYSSTEVEWNWKELAVVSAAVIVLSLVLWWRFLPLPETDLGFYTEPAYLLAKFGTLVGPASQYIDLTYQKGMYNYPPGYYLILGGWIKTFGLSDDSLLGFTHLVHSGILILLWALVRYRYACSRLISTLTLVSIFPKAPHGRPDMLACLLGIAAWLALPADKNWKRIALSGALAGASLLVSPAFGVASIVTLMVLIGVNKGFPWKERLRVGLVWLVAAGILFAGVTALVLAWQNSWTLAFVQFAVNVKVRGPAVNQMPQLRILYVWVFSMIPFVLLGLLPAVIVALASLRKPPSQLGDVTLAFLGASAVWLALNKSQLLLEYHYLFPAKSVFLAVLCSYPRVPTWVRVLPLLLLSTIGWYLFKGNYLYLATPLRMEHARYAPDLGFHGELAVDSLYFATAYDPGRTLHYYPLRLGVLWPAYQAAIPPKFRAEILSGLADRPAVPVLFVVSAFTVARFGEPDEGEPRCTKRPKGFENLRLLGRTWNMPANPYSLIVCTSLTK